MASAPGVPGRLRVVHTQLLVRSAARTPLRALEPESFWRATLPSEHLFQRLRREGGAAAVGARRRRPLPTSDGNRGIASADVWAQLTTRGADEARAVGMRLERWLFTGRENIGEESEEEHEDGGGADGSTPAESKEQQRPRDTRRVPVTAISPPDERAELTARAVLGGLALPTGMRVPIDTATGVRLQVGASMTSGDEETAARFVANTGVGFSAQGDAAARHDAALDLLELLQRGGASFDSDAMRSMLEAAGWPQLLDVAECAGAFGLVPRGELSTTTRRAIFGAPVRAARALVADESLAADAVGPLLRTLLSPSVRAAKGFSREQVRVTVLPGFSMLCWAAALGLDKALVWPAPGMDYLVETLVNDSQEAFLRIWQFRDTWEIRPTWHEGKGPVNFGLLQDDLRHLLSPSTASSDTQLGGSGGRDSRATSTM